MLELIHRNRKTLAVVIIVAAVALTMSGFGLDYYFNNRSTSAITVNGEEVSFQVIDQRRQMLQEQYQQMFGPRYFELLQQLNLNLNQQVIDSVINDTLLRQFAREHEFHVGDDQVAEAIRAQFPGGQFSREQYAALLRSMGTTSRMFEYNMREMLLRQQVATLLHDVALPSDREVRAALREYRTSYDIAFVTFDPARLRDQVPAPSEEELSAFYDQNATDYEVPAKVSYDYVVYDPAQNLDAVPVLPEDIELYYSDNESRFREPEQVKLRQIRISLPSEASKEQRDAIRARAEGVLAEALANVPFDSLAQQHSDDVATNLLGGDLGWVARGAGKVPSAVERAVFATDAGQITDLVETADALYILKVEEKREARTKDLNEVRDEIVALIQQEAAPAFTAERAHLMFDEWTSSGQPLREIARDTRTTQAPLPANEAPEPALQGLTAQVLEDPTTTSQLIELGERTVLVEVTDYQEAFLPPLAEVREKVLADYRANRAQFLAREQAEQLRLLVSESKNLLESAKAQGLEIEQVQGMSRAAPGSSALATPDIASAVFAAQPMGEPTPVLQRGTSWIVAQVQQVTLPRDEPTEKELRTHRERQQAEMRELLLRSLLNSLKARAKIDIHPSVMAQS